MKKWMIPAILLLFLASGCQNNRGANDQAAYDLRNDRSTPNFMSNRAKDKQHLVEDDITNQNPNFLDLSGTGSGGEAGASNHGIDIDKAKLVIADTHEFTTDSVWINGDRMWVSVFKKGTLTDREKIAAQARLHKKLVTALPRYNIEVSVKGTR